ncbi:uncharacterized protein V1510DRAFT_413294 [Dipodascopsis tothii]|uniref:uncharacterized protein n=1 Tax=Dipodascopsis tothii TaxID=44089 RepID=UPI0034CFCAC4
MDAKQSISELAAEWLRLDQAADTRREIEALLAADNTAELERRLRKRITFGTAGLRAKMEAGFSRMNDLTVLQASQGLARYVEANVPDALARGIVIGHDHRHHSEDFARLTACAFLTAGFKVHFFDELVHTPLVAYATAALGAACGVMVTASHNPAADNGYKVYWSNGCQIVSPHDKGISAAIEANLEPWVWDYKLVETAAAVERPRTRIMDLYYGGLGRLAGGVCVGDATRVVYTPMHGVGLPYMERAAALLGAQVGTHVLPVPTQIVPDADFPTVRFPNPEEAGALDQAKAYADAQGVDVVLATDPDADRFAAAVRSSTGGWRQLTGNEMGILFAHYVWRTTPAARRSKLAMLNSTASSRVLQAFAAKEGFYCEETLTGFKWLGNRAITLEQQGYVVPFAFEEAIGYMFEGLYEKDGIGAALVFLKLVADLRTQLAAPPDATDADLVLQYLDEIYGKYGFFENNNSYYVSLDPAATQQVFRAIRSGKIPGRADPADGLRFSQPLSPVSTPAEQPPTAPADYERTYPYPKTVGARRVTYWRDLTEGYDSATADHVPQLPVSRSSEMITFALDGEAVRVTIRGSGTEPKLKVYIEATAPQKDAARRMAAEVWDDLEREWFTPKVTGLLKA